MNKTKIEWTDYTWNPITGCLNHTNGLCKGGGFPCYAYKLAHGRLKERYLANGNYAPMTVASIDDPFYPRIWPERLYEPWYHKKPSKIFVCDMGELFGDWIPDAWTREVLAIVRQCSQHTFQLLTKQPQNLAKWSPFPSNCWVGVTATNTKMFVDALDSFNHVEAKVKFVSIEPLLEWHIGGFLLTEILTAQQLDWLIIGAQTKPYKPPKIEWVQEIVEAADKAGIPVFLKDNLGPLIVSQNASSVGRLGIVMDSEDETILDLKLRQEFPKC